MSIFFFLTLFFFLVAPVAAHTNPKDALINPRGQKVCMQQCGTSALQCPEAFWIEQIDHCYRCCSTWGETVIKVDCAPKGRNVTQGKQTVGGREKPPGSKQEKDIGRELGFS